MKLLLILVGFFTCFNLLAQSSHTSGLLHGSFIDQDDVRLKKALGLNLNEGTMLCGPVSILNWLIADRAGDKDFNLILSEASSINWVIENVQKMASKSEILNGLSIENFIRAFKTTIPNYDLFSFPAGQAFTKKIGFDFMLIRTKDQGYSPLDSAFRTSYHYVLVTDVDWVEKRISFIDPQNPNHLSVVSFELDGLTNSVKITPADEFTLLRNTLTMKIPSRYIVEVYKVQKGETSDHYEAAEL